MLGSLGLSKENLPGRSRAAQEAGTRAPSTTRTMFSEIGAVLIVGVLVMRAPLLGA